MSGRPRRILAALGVAAVVVVADQVTKSIAEADLHRAVHLVGPFGLNLGYNSGSAFSLFAGRAALVGPVAGVIVVAILWATWRARTTAISVALGLVLGGALGNLGDRAFRGHGGSVVDFITLTHWPTFNVADSCITVGTVLLVVALGRAPRIHRAVPGITEPGGAHDD